MKNPNVRKGLGILCLIVGVLEVVGSVAVFGPGHRFFPAMTFFAGLWLSFMGYALIVNKWMTPGD